ncbi:initiation-control protein YabA [Ligilactobacillus cholophilus]|uniref:initiation-control protein YabA n=1 Tax=Ligilactobacillus cholophilus TaxID=3050131 RepID=UPI0025B17ED9|nr:DNA replication initiation control protein YabA [Ligilactobacillus cholophilus]
MDKGELYDSFETMEQQALTMSQLLSSMRKEMTQIIEKNAQLEVENSHLRERLSELESNKKSKKTSHGLSNLEKLYHEGFHVCTQFFGSRREDDECIFCQQIIYGDKWREIDGNSKE